MLEYPHRSSRQQSRRLDQVFRALAHPVRREILSRMGAGEQTIS